MNIAIIGCGYIGSALSIFWNKKKYNITATTRSSKKLKILGKFAQRCSLFYGGDENTITSLVNDNDIIVLTLSADTLNEYENTFLKTAQALRHAAIGCSSPRRLIYTSNAMIYGDHQGKWVDENSFLFPSNDATKILIETENILLSTTECKWDVCIYRLGEIYGPGREISKKIKKLKHMILWGKGDFYTNMIHQEDIIRAIDYSLQFRLKGIYNLADDDHPTQKIFYEDVCQKLHLEQLIWDKSHELIPRINARMSNHKIKSAGFSFLYPHRLLS